LVYGEPTLVGNRAKTADSDTTHHNALTGCKVAEWERAWL
jgi:hypothetical protein